MFYGFSFNMTFFITMFRTQLIENKETTSRTKNSKIKRTESFFWMDSSIIILGVPSWIELDEPLIAAVAAGRELALYCDFRVMEQSTYFGVYCRHWGIPFGAKLRGMYWQNFRKGIMKKWAFTMQAKPTLHTTYKLAWGLLSKGYGASIPMNLF